MSEPLLTLREAAERMGLSVARLRDLARKGQLPASKHAGRWLVEVEALQPIPISSQAGRAHGAESAALNDLASHLQHRGVVVSEAKAQPGRTVAERAHSAQAEALDHLQQRLDKPQVPERSI